MANKRSVTLTIAGHTLSIRSDKDGAYLRELAAYLDSIINELQGTSSSTRASTYQLLLLAALNVTDELFQSQDRLEALKGELDQRTRAIIRTLDGVPSG